MWNWFKREEVSRSWVWVAFVAYLAMLIVNGLAGSTMLIGGQNTAMVSDTYGNLLTPAGVTFAIWGVIYVLLGILFFRLFGVWKTANPQLPARATNKMLKWFTVSSVLNICWLFAWQYELLGLSVVLMLGLLATLAHIHRLVSSQQLSRSERVAMRAPFSVYFGWITIATIADITAWLVSIDWSGWGISPTTWTVVILSVAAVVGIIAGVVRRDSVYLLVFVWAYFGILIKHMSSSGFDGRYSGIIVALSILIAILLAATVLVATISAALRAISWKTIARFIFT